MVFIDFIIQNIIIYFSRKGGRLLEISIKNNNYIIISNPYKILIKYYSTLTLPYPTLISINIENFYTYTYKYRVSVENFHTYKYKCRKFPHYPTLLTTLIIINRLFNN